jgi:hypothetical protein
VVGDEFFRELMADALGKSPEELQEYLGESQKICDIFVQRVYLDENLRDFDWGVSVIRFNGNELEEAATYATFRSWKLAKEYGNALKEFFKSKGYEAHLKGELG